MCTLQLSNGGSAVLSLCCWAYATTYGKNQQQQWAPILPLPSMEGTSITCMCLSFSGQLSIFLFYYFFFVKVELSLDTNLFVMS